MLLKFGIIQKVLFALFLALFIQAFGVESLYALNPKDVPVIGQVNLVDLGADYCLPCKMMAPIMTKLEKDYKGKAAVIFIDVEKFPDQAKRFGIRAIPTQIFYDKMGKEIYRHLGFLSEKDIVAQLKKMGVN
jgi:thioredoxin 1